MIELKEHNGRQLTSAKALYNYLEIKRKFSVWIKESINIAKIEIEKDFVTYVLQSSGGRPMTDYLLTQDASMRVILQSRMPKSIDLIDLLTELFKQRQELELITPKEAALAYEYINFFKYVENQKDAYLQHQKMYIDKSPVSKYVYAEFAKYRANIVGWDKSKIDEAIKVYLTTHAGHNFTKLMKESMPVKLSILDINEAIRVSILDLLYSKGTNTELANKFANMVKNISSEMDILALKKNETNLYQQKEIIDIKRIN